MSIKYSGILAADEVLSAGNDDIIVLAIVDGGAPTGQPAIQQRQLKRVI
jgi:hypothetical protein